MKKLLFVALILACQSASAENLYAFVGMGQSIVNSTYADTSNPTSYQATLGYTGNSGLGVELSRTEIGKLESKYITAKMKASSLVLVKKFSVLPSYNNFKLLMKGGVSRASTEFGIMALPSQSKTGLTFGVGFQFDISDGWLARFDYSSLDTGVNTIGRAQTGIISIGYGL